MKFAAQQVIARDCEEDGTHLKEMICDRAEPIEMALSKKVSCT
jgi:hypothetical protein